MKKLLITGGIFGSSVAAFALGTYLKVAQETYQFPQGSPAATAKCMLCHLTKMGHKLNPYGLQLKAALHGSKRMTPAILESVENRDSAKANMKVGEALKSGRLPG